MKKILVIYVLLFCCMIGFSQTMKNGKYYYWSDADGEYYFEFRDNTFVLYDFPTKGKQHVPLPGYEDELTAVKVYGNYVIENRNGYNYLIIENKEYLLLSDGKQFCVLYDLNRNHSVYYGVIESSINSKRKVPYINTPEWEKDIKVSSALEGQTNNGIRYQPPFNRVKYESVWAYSIEKDTEPYIEMDGYSGLQYLLICNGMIYPENMNYFSFNARPKVIELSYVNKKDSIVLGDTPNPQIIKLSSNMKEKQKIRISIKSYYKGSRYSDAVISFIGLLGKNIE